MCCGKAREQLQQKLLGLRPPNPVAAGIQQARPAGNGARSFEYVGRTSMTVVGGSTGRRYRFERPGARVSIDPRDRPSVASIRALRQVPL